MSDFQRAMERLQMRLAENELQASEERLKKAKIEREAAEVALERERIHKQAIDDMAASHRIDMGINVKPKGDA